MKRCFIVGAGSIFEGDLPFETTAEDLVIAADGGLLALQKSGMTPDLLIGDFDSMENPNLSIETLILPVEKDDTDLVYAVKEGFARGYKDFVLYGALGGARFSHTFANLQLLAYIKEQGGQGVLIGGKTHIWLLKEESMTFSFPVEAHCSVLAYSPQAGVSLNGLYYPLEKGRLTNRFPLGVSNHLVDNQATITVHEGTVLLIIEE